MEIHIKMFCCVYMYIQNKKSLGIYRPVVYKYKVNVKGERKSLNINPSKAVHLQSS